MAFPADRPRRLRQSPAMRRLVRETHVQPSQLVLPMFIAEGISRAPADRQHARRRAAHARHGPQGVRRGGCAGARRRHAVRRAGAQGRPGVRRARSRRHPQRRAGRCPGRGRRRPADHVRSLPRRVHRPRALRCARRPGPGRQRRDARDLCPDGCRAGRVRSPRRRAQRHDGRPGRRHPCSTRRCRTRRHRDPGVCREVLLRLLRSVPRGRRVVAQGRPQDVPAGPGQRPRGDPRGAARHRARVPTSSWSSRRCPTST